MRAILPALALLAAAPAMAQDEAPPLQPLPEMAGELAYGFCPMLMNGTATLADNAALQSRGFPARAEPALHPRVPDLALLSLTRPDGDITLGGIPQTICQVTVLGAQAEAALVTMRAGLPDLRLALEADPANSGPGPGGRGLVETLVMPLPGSGVVRVQFLQTSLGNGTPMASFQIMFQEQ